VQHELAHRLGLNRSHLVGYLDEIEQRGLVERVRDPEDRRRQRVAITASGRTVFRRLKGAATRSERLALDVLSETERETLTALLRRVVVADDEARAGESPVA
jgi:DNA-binding MarR family transcriptional regulator